MSYPKPVILSSEGRTIKIQHPQLPGQPKTYLSAAVTAAGVTLTVADNHGFSNAGWLRVGSIGTERAESIRINGAVTHGTSLTVTAVVFDHPQGAEIESILFDKWRIYGNTTDTTAGATLIDTIDVKWDEDATTYVNSGTEYNYYYAIGYDSNAASSFTYSDGIPKDTGWVEGTVGSVIESAFTSTKIERERVSTNWLFKEINDCLRAITGKLKRWSFLQVFDYSIGSVIQGTFSFTLPTDIEDANSPKSILGFRIGTSDDLVYKDKDEWESLLQDVAYTTVRTQASAGDTSLNIDNSYDFNDAGSVDIFVSGVKYTITYTGVTRSTTAGVLTGIPASGTGSISVTTPVASGVWQQVQEGSPKWFTVYDGTLKFWPLADSAKDYTNATLDYYSKKTKVDSFADVIEGSRYDAVASWLKWKLRSLNNSDGKLDMTDGDYLMYQSAVGDMIRMETSGQKADYKRKPNGISY